MLSDALAGKAQTYLMRLCTEIPERQTGSSGNRLATDFFAEQVAAAGFEVATPTFDCMDWQTEGVDLSVGSEVFEAIASPYSLGCQFSAPLVAVANIEEMQATELAGQIALLQGEIAREQLMPKNFPFYNPDEHRHIISLLEHKQPLAILSATGRDTQMAGAVYPFPLFEDGDFNIPSAYLTEEAGRRLARHIGEAASLTIRAMRTPAQGCNVTALKGANSEQRVICFAHIDAKKGTPGAIDNAGGVVVLLLLADLLADYAGSTAIELVALNGEDYYSAPGEQDFLTRNADRFAEIALGINIDGVGYHKGRTSYSFYECPEHLSQKIGGIFADYIGLTEGEPWYQGDHMLFVLNRRPTLAFTSECVSELMQKYVHTARDDVTIVAPHKLAELAVALHRMLLSIGA